MTDFEERFDTLPKEEREEIVFSAIVEPHEKRDWMASEKAFIRGSTST